MADPAAVASAGSRWGDRAFGRPAAPPQHRQASPAATAIHVWSSRLDELAWSERASGVIDGDERARASRFRFERDRRRFVARRVFLREVLSAYLRIEPGTIRYRPTREGRRPELESSGDLSFSASHSDGLAVVAVAQLSDGLVGVDIERVRPIPDAIELARTLFTTREQAHLASSPATARPEAFLRLWTRKEACVKALGLGMQVPFDTFEVAGDGPIRVRAVAGAADGGRCVVVGLGGLPGFVGSVALSSPDADLREVAVKAIAP